MAETLLDKAIEFARIAHFGQTRKNGEEYVAHPLRVMENLKNVGINNEEMLCAAVLHATTTFGKVKPDEIRKEFGDDVAYLVDQVGLLSDLQIPRMDDQKKIALLHKTIFHLAQDSRVLIIRLADRLDNIRTVSCLSPDEQKWTAEQTLYIFAPIAKAVGLYAFAREMQDEAFRILNPERYELISAILETEHARSEHELEELTQVFRDFLISEQVTFEVSYRKKSIYSTHLKAEYKASKNQISSPDAINELYDLLGLRVLVSTPQECYQTLAFIQENWEIVQNEYDDYIKNPKANGYRTLQMAIKIHDNHFCEVQIRTFEMEEFNEFGPASHFHYKYGTAGRKSDASWIKELISQKESLQQGLGKDSKLRVFDDEVFVFTPKGDLVHLPKGATVIDFAYGVHSDVGNHAIGAKINGHFVPVDTPLSSGQTIEVVTAGNHRPSKDWLRIIKTREAKRQIRKALGID